MGARTNFTFRTETGDLTLYSHWGGDSKSSDLAAALKAALPRINMLDTSYALRIIVSQLIGESWNEETGFGLFVGSEGGEESYDWVIVNLVNNTVTFDSIPHMSIPIKEYVDTYLYDNILQS
jgi:hypothetical protein